MIYPGLLTSEVYLYVQKLVLALWHQIAWRLFTVRCLNTAVLQSKEQANHPQAGLQYVLPTCYAAGVLSDSDFRLLGLLWVHGSCTCLPKGQSCNTDTVIMIGFEESRICNSPRRHGRVKRCLPKRRYTSGSPSSGSLCRFPHPCFPSQLNPGRRNYCLGLEGVRVLLRNLAVLLYTAF